MLAYVAGRKLSMPVLVAPMAAMLMAHKEGEPATARAAVAANTCMVCSCLPLLCSAGLLLGTQARVMMPNGINL